MVNGEVQRRCEKGRGREFKKAKMQATNLLFRKNYETISWVSFKRFQRFPHDFVQTETLGCEGYRWNNNECPCH